MKIVNESNTTFGALEVGEWFVIQRANLVFVKIEKSVIGGEVANAVSVGKNVLPLNKLIPSDTEVTLIEVENDPREELFSALDSFLLRLSIRAVINEIKKVMGEEEEWKQENEGPPLG